MKKITILLMILILISVSACQMVMDDDAIMSRVNPYNPSDGKDIASLPQAQPMMIVDLDDGDTYKITAELVRNTIAKNEMVMLAYNRQIPGPVLRVPRNATITVPFTNNIEHETTIHWHGLRHDNIDDGVPDVTQPPVKPGETYTYTVHVPDDGMFWYHPHVREDLQQGLGLAGNLWVVAGDRPKVNREEVLVLDDILLQDGKQVPFGKEYANFAIMGRFGNTMLVNGKEDYSLSIWGDEVIRFYITNIANVRPFNISFGGAKMKLVGGDIGLMAQPKMVDHVVLFPAERQIVDVFFDQPTIYNITHTNPEKTYRLGAVLVTELDADDNYQAEFENLEPDQELMDDINRFRQYFTMEPDYEIDLTIDMPKMDHKMEDEDHTPQSIEWEDTMLMMNSMSSTKDTKWILRDKATKKENMDFMLDAKVGDVIKIRFFNDPESDHPMQHPMHLHGQRFLVLNPDGTPYGDLVWKDTAVIPAGETVDLLVDVTNPGDWMMHCHIAEHLTAGMMTMLRVTK